MKCLAVTMLLLAGCVSVNAGRAKQEQQYPTWVQELAERRAEALEAEAEPEAEAEGDAESATVERPAAGAPSALKPASGRPATRKSREEMNGPEKIQEGVRLLREASAKRQQAARLMDEEEPRLSREKEELRRQRREFDR